MNVTVIGCGYVGIVTAACLAEIGHRVVCTDSDHSKIRTLKDGKLPIYEPYLDELVTRGCRQGRLSFTKDAAEAVNAGEIVFICVGTPPLKTGDADLTAIDRVARLVATESLSPKLVIEKSTVPARTGRQLKRALAIYTHNSALTFTVASNPEFLREGTAVLDFLHPHRIVVGVENLDAECMLRELYRPIVEETFNCPVHKSCPPREEVPFIVTSIESAELIKHASNSFLALKISYINTIADLCERLGGDVEEVARAMGFDPRIGPQFLRAGLGFGGFCFPKDIQAFIRLAETAGVDFALLKEAERVNKGRIDSFLEKIKKALWVVNDKQIGILGLAFKPNTDDIRFAPAIELIKKLLAEGAQIRAYDPQAMEKARALFPKIRYSSSPSEVAEGADALLLVTEWEQFRALDWQRIHDLMHRPLLLDGRNFLDPTLMRHIGFEYYSVGRPESDGISSDGM